MRKFTIGELFTDAELKQAMSIYKYTRAGFVCDRMVSEIVQHALPRINKLTEQENDPRYLGYMLEWAMIQQSQHT